MFFLCRKNISELLSHHMTNGVHYYALVWAGVANLRQAHQLYSDAEKLNNTYQWSDHSLTTTVTENQMVVHLKNSQMWKQHLTVCADPVFVERSIHCYLPEPDICSHQLVLFILQEDGQEVVFTIYTWQRPMRWCKPEAGDKLFRWKKLLKPS